MNADTLPHFHVTLPVTFPSLSLQTGRPAPGCSTGGTFWKGYKRPATAWSPSARLPSPAPVLSPDALLPAHRPRRPLPSGPVTPQSGHQAQWRWAVTAPDRPLSLHLPRRPAAGNSDIHKWRRFKVSGALLPSLRPALHPHAEYPPPAPPARRPRCLLSPPGAVLSFPSGLWPQQFCSSH